MSLLRTLASLRGSAALVALLIVITLGVVLSGPASFGRSQQGAEAALLSEVKKLTASDAQTDDVFGWSVAVSGDTAVVGAIGEAGGGSSAGAAYVFQVPVSMPTPTPGPTKQPDPGDTDGDGCTDVQENGPIEALGGRRDYLNFWDFFDTPASTPTTRDKVINIVDIGAVALRFGTVSDPPATKEEALAQAFIPPPDLTSYHAAFDRGGPIPGEDLWDLLPPDGAINIIDIGATVIQFGHTCR